MERYGIGTDATVAGASMCSSTPCALLLPASKLRTFRCTPRMSLTAAACWSWLCPAWLLLLVRCPSEHIQKQLERGYAVKDEVSQTFAPTALGESLISSYRRMGLDNLWKPDLRGRIEQGISRIAAGQVCEWVWHDGPSRPVCMALPPVCVCAVSCKTPHLA